MLKIGFADRDPKIFDRIRNTAVKYILINDWYHLSEDVLNKLIEAKDDSILIRCESFFIILFTNFPILD